MTPKAHKVVVFSENNCRVVTTDHPESFKDLKNCLIDPDMNTVISSPPHHWCIKEGKLALLPQEVIEKRNRIHEVMTSHYPELESKIGEEIELIKEMMIREYYVDIDQRVTKQVEEIRRGLNQRFEEEIESAKEGIREGYVSDVQTAVSLEVGLREAEIRTRFKFDLEAKVLEKYTSLQEEFKDRKEFLEDELRKNFSDEVERKVLNKYLELEAQMSSRETASELVSSMQSIVDGMDKIPSVLEKMHSNMEHLRDKANKASLFYLNGFGLITFLFILTWMYHR